MTKELHVIAGPMFAAKTSALISMAKNYIAQQKTVVAVKPGFDKRYNAEDICTHDGISFKEETNSTVEVISNVSSVEVLLSTLQLLATRYDVVMIDEAQFFPRLDFILKNIMEKLEKDCVFICAGLDMDSAGNPFGEMPALLTYATYVLKLRAECNICHEQNATQTFRKLNSPKGTIVVGGAELYEARCFEHWIAGENEKAEFVNSPTVPASPAVKHS